MIFYGSKRQSQILEKSIKGEQIKKPVSWTITIAIEKASSFPYSPLFLNI